MNFDDIASVEDLNEEQIRGKNVLVRVSYDAFDKGGSISDSLRIEASEGTIKALKKLGARRIILMCYVGRPSEYDPAYSLKPAADFLYGVFKEKVHFVSSLRSNGAFIAKYQNYINCAKEFIESMMQDGEIVMLDNLRFWPEENAGDEGFARAVASLGDIYVQDGFAQAHRMKNATVGSIVKYIGLSVMGSEFKKEVTYLRAVWENLVKEKRKPFIFIIAGKKIETKPGIVSKITVASKLMDSMKRGDKVLIGGAIAYPFILAKKNAGKEFSPVNIKYEDMRKVIGDSFIEKEQVYDHMNMAQEIFQKGEAMGIDVVLPEDHVVAVAGEIKNIESIAPGMKAGDIGSKTVESWKKFFSDADTIVLSGPVGWFENPLFSRGSREISKAIGDTTENGTTTIAAGGDTSSMVRKFGFQDNYSLVSIGGGATLEFLMQGSLPVMDVLDRKLEVRT